MQKDKASPNNSVVSSPKKGGTKKISRRSVLKSLILVPVNLTLWLPVVKAQRMVGVFPEGKAIPGNRFKGLPAGQASDLYTPNQPFGKAQGIVPGRVSWVWNPASTNPAVQINRSLRMQQECNTTPGSWIRIPTRKPLIRC